MEDKEEMIEEQREGNENEIVEETLFQSLLINKNIVQSIYIMQKPRGGYINFFCKGCNYMMAPCTTALLLISRGLSETE